MNLSLKTINIPGWAQAFGANNGRITKASQGFSRIPILRRSVNVIADSLVSLPYEISQLKPDAPSTPPVNADGTPGDTTPEEADDAEWPFTNDFETLLGETVRAYLIEGAAFWLKQANQVTVRSLQWLNPQTMQVEFKGYANDGAPALEFKQQNTNNPKGGTKPSKWTQKDIVYFRQWQIEDDIQPGPSVVSCVLDAAKLHYYLTRFGKTTFENGAMPFVVMSVSGNPGKDEVERAESTFKNLLTGVQNAFRLIALRGIWEPKVISPNLNTLAMPELAAYALQQVSIGMGIPETALSDAANFATAAQHDLQFWRNTIVPLANYFAHVINTQLLNPMGLELAFLPEQLDVFQEDESQRAASLVSLTDSGLPLDWAMQILGYDLPKGMTYEQLVAMLAERRASAPSPILPPPQPLRGDVTPPEDLAGTDGMSKRAVLRAWQRFQSARVGKKNAREFITEELDPALKGAIAGSLVDADLGEVRRVFDDANQGVYP